MNPPLIIGSELGATIVTEGQTVTLSCVSNNDNPSLIEEFQWFDPDGVALGQIGITEPHFLTLDNVTRDQSGVYTCTISTGGISSSDNITLVVQCKRKQQLLHGENSIFHKFFSDSHYSKYI